LDINVLKKMVGDEPGTLYELLKEFLGALSAGMDSIKSAAGAEGFDEVVSMAHRLKSSSRSVGALPLGDACAELENSSRLGNKAIAAEAVAAFEAAAAELLPKLREQLQKLEASLHLDLPPRVSEWDDHEDPSGRR
jgi:HPt (histidine-containing phosphotransfer) domain-containing protein